MLYLERIFQKHLGNFIVQNSWPVLLPPLVVLAYAFATRKVKTSLVIGIVAAALIATDGSPLATLRLTLERTWQELAALDNLFLFSFLFILGIIVALLNHTGGAIAFGRTLTKRLSSARNAETASLLLSPFFFIDDYLNALTVGCVMRPITDRFKIPRAKLAFLIDSMAAPLSIIVPVTSWVAMITRELSRAGVSPDPAIARVLANPLTVYLKSIPFIFYSFMIPVVAHFVVRRRISFGSMRKQEEIAQKTGNLLGGKPPLNTSMACHDGRGGVADFVIPIVTLVLLVITFLLWFGDYWLLGGQSGLMQALQQSDIFAALFCSGLATLTVSLGMSYVRQTLLWRETGTVIHDGISLILPSMLTLMLAWTLSTLLRVDLHSGEYLASILLGPVSITMLPVMFFATSLIIATTIGSSWATIGILTPLAVPMLIAFLHPVGTVSLAQMPLFFAVLGAIFSGAVAGDHVSPISDTTVMSSASTNCYHMDHVQTQLTYAIPTILGTALAYLIAGLTGTWHPAASIFTSLSVGLLVTLALLVKLGKKA